MNTENTRQKCLASIAWGILANSVIIFFWLPLLFIMPPGDDYRPMCSAPLSLFIAGACLIHALIMGWKQASQESYQKERTYVILVHVMPMVLFLVFIILLHHRGNYWSE
jgi:hypothetical protein